jgi:hypothetical protein
MGCDIHMYAEAKVADLDLDAFCCIAREDFCYRRRNYYLFARLGGVRQDADELRTIAAKRGLPLNCSAEVRAAMVDYHSVSWVSLDELLADGIWDHEDEVHCRAFLAWIRTLHDSGIGRGSYEALRFVFGFDN